MCKAVEYTNQLLEIYNNITKDCNNLTSELSRVDKYEQDILHTIENENFNAAEGYKLAKILHDNRQVRRSLKNEIETLHKLKNNFVDIHIKNLNDIHKAIIKKDNTLTTLKENKVYNPRSQGKPIDYKITDNKETNKPCNKEVVTYKKTGEELNIISEVEKGRYYVLFTKTGSKGVVNQKDIIKSA